MIPEDNSPTLLAQTLIEIGSLLNVYKEELATEKWHHDQKSEELKKLKDDNERLTKKIVEYGNVYRVHHALLLEMSTKYKGKFLERIKGTLKNNNWL